MSPGIGPSTGEGRGEVAPAHDPGRGAAAARPPAPRRPAWAPVPPLALLALAAFLPALHNGFVNWDDDKNFLENTAFRGLGPDQLAWAARTFRLGAYQPLAWLLFGAQYSAFGLDPRGYHLTSLALHAANAVALFALILALLRRRAPDRSPDRPWAAALAAALFAVHPLRTEPVAWASGQPYLPCSLFSILSVLAYLRATSGGTAARRAWLAASFALFLAALLSHAVAVGLPVVLLILDAYPLRRLARPAAMRAALREKVPFVIASLLFMALAVAARSQALADVPPHGPTAAIAQACYAAWFYVAKTALPIGLAAVYPAPRAIDWLEPRFLAAIVATAAVTAALILVRRRWPGPLVAWLAYLAILAPNSGLVRTGDQLAADRYSYLATIPWAVAAAVALGRLGELASRSRPAAIASAALAVVALATLSAMSWAQCRTWRDSAALWAHALAHGAGDSPLAHNNWGVALAAQGRYAAAAAQYAEALRLDPDYASARNSLGVALAAQGKYAAAAAQYAEALRLRPRYASAHNNLGVALTHLGRYAPAATHLAEAIQINPAYASAHNNLGVALVSLGSFAAASAHFAEAVRFDPTYAEAHNNLAMILAACPEASYRDGRKAVESATHACELKGWRNPMCLNTLAAAYAESGDFDAAVTWQTKAMRFLKDEGMKEDYEARLELYRTRQPYRQRPPVHASTEVRP